MGKSVAGQVIPQVQQLIDLGLGYLSLIKEQWIRYPVAKHKG